MNRILLYIMLFISLELSAQIEPILDSDEQRVAEPFMVRYELSKESKWTLPTLKKRLVLQKNLEIVKVTFDTISEKPYLNLQLIAFDSGIYTIPSFKFSKGNQEIHSFAKDIHVSRVKVNTLQKPIYDIKPIKESSRTLNDYFNKYRWILTGILGSFILGIIGFLIYWLVKNKPFSKKGKPEIPPGEEALLALSNLKKEKVWKQDTKIYYSKLTDVLRYYFERKLKFDAPESTSDEILCEMKPFLDDDEYNSLHRLLHESDLVKFAKSSPDEAKHIEYMDGAVNLVQSLEEKIVEEEEEEIAAPIEIKTTYFDFMGTNRKQLPKGNFALWWKNDLDDYFTDSVSQKVWDTFYEHQLIFCPYILGAFLYEKKLSVKKEEVFFPEIEQQFVFENDHIGVYLVSISKEKGFMILMNTRTVTKEQRRHFLIKWSISIQDFTKNEIPKHKQNEYKKKSYGTQAKNWYSFIKGMVIKSEKQRKVINQIAGKKLE
ncbi:MAG: hypothetical protein ACK5MD_03605 [Flavobacteriales bacterium]